MKAQLSAFNKEKALVGAFSVYSDCETSRRFVASAVCTVCSALHVVEDPECEGEAQSPWLLDPIGAIKTIKTMILEQFVFQKLGRRVPSVAY